MTKAAPNDSTWALLALQRFALASIVVTVHLSWFSADPNMIVELFMAIGGKAAVIGFLFISGYSIAASIDKMPQGFYIRRLYRIYPLYFLALLLTFTLELLTLENIITPGHLFESLGPITAIGNLFFLQTIAVSAIAYNVAVWSISIEFIYYITAPLITSKNNKIAFQIAAMLSMIAFISNTNETYGIAWYAFTKLKVIKYFWCWYAGFYVYFNCNKTTIFWTSLLAAAASILSQETPEILAPMLIAFVFFGPQWIHKIGVGSTMKKIANYLGDLSYSLYLFHLPIMIWAWHYLEARNAAWLCLASLIASAIAMHLVEYRLKPKFIKPLLPKF